MKSAAKDPSNNIEVCCPECGGFFWWQPKYELRARSLVQLKRYMLLVRLVWENWPEEHEEQFMRWDDCRKWLQMKAGFREIDGRIPLTGIPKGPALAMARVLLQQGAEYKVPVIHKGHLVIWRAASIAFHNMGQAKFNALNDAVTDVIVAETNLNPQKLINDYFALKEARKEELRRAGEEHAKEVLG